MSRHDQIAKRIRKALEWKWPERSRAKRARSQLRFIRRKQRHFREMQRKLDLFGAVREHFTSRAVVSGGRVVYAVEREAWIGRLESVGSWATFKDELLESEPVEVHETKGAARLDAAARNEGLGDRSLNYFYEELENV